MEREGWGRFGWHYATYLMTGSLSHVPCVYVIKSLLIGLFLFIATNLKIHFVILILLNTFSCVFF